MYCPKHGRCEQWLTLGSYFKDICPECFADMIEKHCHTLTREREKETKQEPVDDFKIRKGYVKLDDDVRCFDGTVRHCNDCGWYIGSETNWTAYVHWDGKVRKGAEWYESYAAAERALRRYKARQSMGNELQEALDDLAAATNRVQELVADIK